MVQRKLKCVYENKEKTAREKQMGNEKESREVRREVVRRLLKSKKECDIVFKRSGFGKMRIHTQSLRERSTKNK